MLNNFYIHNLDPIAFELFGLPIRWYGISYALSFTLSLIYLNKTIKARAIKLQKMCPDELLISVFIGMIIGARIGYVLIYQWEYFITYRNFGQILAINTGGLSFHGGLVGGLLTIYILCKVRSIDYLAVLDVLALVLPGGIFLGRIANFINGELFGTPTTVPWGVIFADGIVRHPSQIYEALLEGLLPFILLNTLAWRTKTLDRSGTMSYYFIWLYSASRILCEMFREHEIMLYGLTMGQILSILMVCGGIILRYKISDNKASV